MVTVRAGSRFRIWLLGIYLAVSGCGYNGEAPTSTQPPPPGPPPPPTQSAISLSLSPTPIAAEVAGEGAAWSAEWTLTIQETAGLGGSIDFVRAILTDSTGASIADTDLDAGEVGERLGGSNHIGGGTRQEILMNLSFDFPTDVRSGDLLVTLQLTDDLGNTIPASASDVIQICVPNLLTPVDGEVMDNGCVGGENGILWEFDWSDCAGAESYHIYVKLRAAPNPVFDRQGLMRSSFTSLNDTLVSEEQRFGWFWRVRARLNGVWSDWSPERDFNVEPANTDCVTP